MVVQKIRKRDGSLVDFDASKISAVIGKAIVAVRGKALEPEVKALTDRVVVRINQLYAEGITEVESVQDIVEQTLMAEHYYDVAKAYILYRERHSQIRSARRGEILKKIDDRELFIINREGQKETFDENVLRNYIRSACKGYEGVINIESLLAACEQGIYEDIETKDIARLAILTARSLIERDPSYSIITTRLFLAALYREVLTARFSPTGLQEAYSKSFVSNIKECVRNGKLSEKMLEFDLELLSANLDIKRDELLPYRGLETLYDNYLIKEGRRGTRYETPQAFWMRVAMGLAINESDKNARALEFYEALSTLRFVSSSPTLYNSGTVKPQLSSCFLTTIGDDLIQIFKGYSDNAQLCKWSGGMGNDWSSLRATGALVKSTGVESQGLIPFLKIANDVNISINRSGRRRGATCAYLEAWHFDIEDFIDLRRNTGDERRRTQDMNIAIWVPDLFVKRILSDDDWTLFSPDEAPELHELYGRSFEEKYAEYESRAENGSIKLFKRLKAAALWKKILTSLYETGHPWVNFKDPCNIRSPQDHAGVVHSSNLCTEITLNTSRDEIAVCNLGSVNLARHVFKGAVDEELLQKTVKIALRMLDNVIDLCYYPVEEARNSNMRHRPIGMGVMGFQDALYMLGINFDSEEAVKFADENMEFISYHAIMSSAELAKERGAYSSFRGSKWDRGIMPVDTLDTLEKERGVKIDVSRTGKMDWAPVREAIKSYGMRNSNCLAIAPTATISNISDCFPSIEPIYSEIYVKSNMSGEFTVVNKYLVEELKANGMWNQSMLDEIKSKDGSIQKINQIPAKIKDKYKNVFEIAPEWLIRIAAYRSKWIDQSQSFNIFTNTTSGKQLSDIYMYAWKMGLKTTYYLRTMGASAIEKSTVGITTQKTKAAAAVMEQVQPIAVENNGVAQVEVYDKQRYISAAQKEAKEGVGMVDMSNVKVTKMGEACDPNDPDCEACQ
ncbi:MAG: ribonucleoside-diphosphate reductase subunit alpha [Candidatus Micrarchaeaceae archaeon]|jgi:ribonucleoside-diphosphate reductase alpha chain|nr:ribonucleoside-diphosphate reductase subunit alpha [Candidatus Micrarchaeota archaeon]HII10093.1 ribonucleoside-diphosphate reductase subunit alpha [Candidatus Micrarchaeota archaeon]